MRYRDHKGGLAESLKTVRNVNNKMELLNYLTEQYSDCGEGITELKFEHLGMDERTNWETYYVLIKLQGQDNFIVAGMSDSNKLR